MISRESAKRFILRDYQDDFREELLASIRGNSFELTEYPNHISVPTDDVIPVNARVDVDRGTWCATFQLTLETHNNGTATFAVELLK